MFDKKNEYALNIADKNAIVYQDAFGTLIRITPEQLPSIKEFRKWKNWSKMKAHTTEKKEHIHRNHSVSLTGHEERVSIMPSVDEAMVAKETHTAHRQAAIAQVEEIKRILTATQFRRLWMYCVDNLSVEEIAHIESATPPAIYKSIRQSKKKIFIYFEKRV